MTIINRVILFTEHYYTSRNKAGFHWIAKAFAEKSNIVTFVTTPISIVNLIKKDYLKFDIKKLNKLKNIDKNIKEFYLFSFMHPFEIDSKNEIINHIIKLFMPIIRKIYVYSYLNNQIKEEIRNANIIIFESSVGLLLLKRIQKYNKKAKYIYRVSDDLRFLKIDNYVRKSEKLISKKFDIISIPSEYVYKKFKTYNLTNIWLQKHCIQKEIFDKCKKNPYKNALKKNAIFIGMSHLDYQFIEIASKQFPNIDFHIIGPFEKECKNINIIYHGLLKFDETIGFIKYADIGLATRSNEKHVGMLSDSLKIIQYEYCKIPIIMPDIIKKAGNYVFKYKYGDKKSIIEAVKFALKAKNNSNLKFPLVQSWSELVESWINGV